MDYCLVSHRELPDSAYEGSQDVSPVLKSRNSVTPPPLVFVLASQKAGPLGSAHFIRLSATG